MVTAVRSVQRKTSGVHIHHYTICAYGL